ncbi:MAG: hypothetical protein U5K53_09515 [Halanaerobiales bacterium]|nr:hypothetical protein [Halanaerobiales bacterium]
MMVHTAYVGPIGNDKNGERIISELKNKEIDVSYDKKTSYGISSN